MMTTVTEMMAPQLYELQYGHYTFYNLTDGHHTKCLNLIQSTTKIRFVLSINAQFLLIYLKIISLIMMENVLKRR